AARAPKPRQIACTRVVLPDPNSPESPMTAGGARPRPNSSPNRLSSSARRRMVHRIPFGLELEELVAPPSGQPEVQLFGRGSPDGLDGGAVGAQEPFLVRVEDCDEGHLGEVEPLA